jgi:site-specific DNA-methyltransferase (adenine-specific)
VETRVNNNCGSRNKTPRKYTPNIANFKFKPKDYWSPLEAKAMYQDSSALSNGVDQIFFEDCKSGMEKMTKESVDLVIADPPFGIDFSGKENSYNRKQDLVMDSYQEIKSDYGQFTEDWMKQIQRIMKPQATAYVFSGWNHLEDVLRGARLAGLTTINHLIWKYQFGVFTKNKYVTSHYHILFLAKNKNNYYFNKMEHYPLDVLDIKRKYKKGEIKNATTLPVELIRQCIEFSSKPGDLVFDPFMGMATTAVVAKSLWRHHLGFELNKNMKSVIDQRLESVSIGQDYLSKEEKLAQIYSTAKDKYPSAYRLYLKNTDGEIHAQT